MEIAGVEKYCDRIYFFSLVAYYEQQCPGFLLPVRPGREKTKGEVRLMKPDFKPYQEKVPNPEELLLEHPDPRHQKLGSLLARYRGKTDALITVLHQAQIIFGYLPADVQIYISDALDVPISEVYGVVTFYSLFSTEPQGKYNISVCLGTACYVKGSGDIMEAFKENLKIDAGETTEDGMFTLNSARCVGACGLAPVLMINGNVYGQLTPDDVPELIERCREAAARGGPPKAFKRRKEVHKDGSPFEGVEARRAGSKEEERGG